MSANPLLQKSSLPNHAPAFDKVQTEHYMPAVEEGIALARKNIDAIKNNKDAPTFENTLVALETASETLGQATSVFYNQLSAVGGDDLHALAGKIGPISANFSSDIILDADLFKRVKEVYDQMDKLDLTPEQKTLLDDTYRGFKRGGASSSPSPCGREPFSAWTSRPCAPVLLEPWRLPRWAWRFRLQVQFSHLHQGVPRVCGAPWRRALHQPQAGGV